MSTPPTSTSTSNISSLLTLASTLESDLRSLSIESRRKYPDLQTSSEHAIVKLRACVTTIQQKSVGEKNVHQLLQSESILHPLLLACATKQSKLTLIALTAIQRLLACQPIHARFLQTVIGTLRIQAESDDITIQLKVLQTLLLSITPAAFDDETPMHSTLQQSLSICFRLYSLKQPIISNTAFAAVRQIVELVFDRTCQQIMDGDVPREITTTPIPASSPTSGAPINLPSQVASLPLDAQHAYMLFRDLVAIATPVTGAPNATTAAAVDNKPKWLNVQTPIAATIGVELLESILVHNTSLFTSHPAFSPLLRKDVCTLVIRSLRSCFDFPMVIRLIRMVTVLVRSYHRTIVGECEILLSLLVRMLEPEFPLWHRILVLEAISSFCSSPTLLYFFYSRYDRSTATDPPATKVFGSLAHALGRFVHQASLDSGGSTSNATVLLWRLQSGKSKGLELLNETEPPHYDELYSVSLSIDAIVAIVNGLHALVTVMQPQVGTENGDDAKLDETPSRIDGMTIQELHRMIDRTILKDMCSVSWMPVLAALSFLLSKSNEEGQIQHILLAYQSFTNTCGLLELTKPRDAFLASLCTFALPRHVISKDDSTQDIITQLLQPDPSPTATPSPTSRQLLTAKNIQSLKALFNIAHCLGSILGSAWLTVLETFEQLDTMINISTELQHRFKREPALAEQYSSLLPAPSELTILSSALTRLFESTKYLDDVAITHVLSALGTLSLASLANAATNQDGESNGNTTQGASPRPIRMFALIHLIATIEHNMFRIGSAKLWELGVGHMTCVINHRDAAVRTYGVQSLTKLTIAALGKRPDGPTAVTRRAKLLEDGSTTPVNTEVATPGRDPVLFQHLLLEPLRDLYRSKFEDTRQNILQSILTILQASGQTLVSGWPTILSILQAVVNGGSAVPISPTPAAIEAAAASLSATPSTPSTPSKDVNTTPRAFIAIGHASISLITNDFLECLPLDSLQLLIETISWYCIQHHDDNISFRSIGLLWRCSDYVARVVGQPRHTGHEETTHGEHPLSDEILTSEVADTLMLCIYQQLQQLSMDVRTEVRNSAVKTLHNTLVAHAARMRPETCIRCLQTLVFPLLQSLLTHGSKPSQGASTTALGKDRDTGKQVMMMVHYSRDTAEKQWDETRVYALQGSSRVMARILEICNDPSDPWFLPSWNTFLSLIESAVLNGSSEVTVAAIAAVQETLQPTSTQATMLIQPTLWEPVMPFQQRIVTAQLNTATTLLPLNHIEPSTPKGTTSTTEQEWQHWNKTTTQIIASFQLLMSNARKLFSDTDIASVLTMCHALASVNATPNVEIRESPLQTATLRLFESLPPLQPDLWITLLHHVMAFTVGVPVPQLAKSLDSLLSASLHALTSPPSTITPSPRPPSSLPFSSSYTRKLLIILDKLVTSAPIHVRITCLHLILQTLGYIISLALHPTLFARQQDTCQEACHTFIHVVDAALPHLHLTPDMDYNPIWLNITTILSMFLSPTTIHTTTTSTSDPYQLSRPRLLTPRADVEEQRSLELLQIEMVGCLEQYILPHSTTANETLQWKLIALLNIGYVPESATSIPTTSITPAAFEGLAHACMQALFQLCSSIPMTSTNDTTSSTSSRTAPSLRIAQMTAPILITRCSQILTSYLAAERQAGECPLPRSRREEVSFLLRSLLRLEMIPSVSHILFGSRLPSCYAYGALQQQQQQQQQQQAHVHVNGVEQRNISVGTATSTGTRGHLLRLFPLLCDGISIRDPEIKEQLRLVFHAAAHEMGLE